MQDKENGKEHYKEMKRMKIKIEINYYYYYYFML